MSIDLAIVSTANYLAGLMPWVPNENIVRGETNGSPPPLPPSIVITELLFNQYTTRRTRIGESETAYIQPKRLDIQLDFYGERSGEMANIATTMLRSYQAVEFFPDGVEPLYCSDPTQAPLITGEKQYERRWSMTFSVQYNQPVTVPQETFNTVGDVEADPVNITTPAE